MPHGNETATIILSPNRSQSFDWRTMVSQQNFTTANVSSFKHAPMSDFWDKLVTENIKVEVVNNDVDVTQTNHKVYWIATVVKVNGYLAKLRYEGYENDSSHDFWEYIFSDDVHGVGWCASQSKTLVPPRNLQSRLPDWTIYLIKKLTGSRTLPANFSQLIDDSLRSRFTPGMKLEVVDKNRVSSVRVATVELAIGGRLLVTYDGADPAEAGFWCHEKSPLVHPIGWAQFIQHELVATHQYAKESLEKLNTKKFEENDATWDMFDLPAYETPGIIRFENNMKLEAIDPLNLSTICVATVLKVLRANFLMIGIDGSMCPGGSDWFCYHASSPYIFPPGYCKKNNLELTNPKNDPNFDWNTYLRDTNCRPAPENLFSRHIPNHGFKVGMMIEAVDLMQSRLVCVATITRIIGRLLRIHFNGWDESFDQWCDCESPDLFPLGWCELVNYPLEPPKAEDSDLLSTSGDASHSTNDPLLTGKKRKSLPKKLTKKKIKAPLGSKAPKD